MAKSASIPITNHGTECTSAYQVKFRPTGTTVWQTTPDQYNSPVVINNLVPSTDYDYQITRQCCNGTPSAAASGTFTTSA